jgi:hypothetical protein
MILEAAKRIATSASPIPYMNKILSDWKAGGIFDVGRIPETAATPQKNGFVNTAVEAANAKSDRERYYSLLREKAQSRAEKFLTKANANARFKQITSELSKMEIALAKAEVFEPQNLPALQDKKKALLQERRNILAELEIQEQDLLPQFTCKNCSDTGFLPSGIACNCYKA